VLYQNKKFHSYFSFNAILPEPFGVIVNNTSRGKTFQVFYFPLYPHVPQNSTEESLPWYCSYALEMAYGHSWGGGFKAQLRDSKNPYAGWERGKPL
jgi:hypothetical protein